MACVAIGAACSFPIALYTSGKIPATVAFYVLGVLWILTTARAVFAILISHDKKTHKNWMIRSYGLAFSAVTLRFLLPIPIVSEIMTGEWAIPYSIICWLAFCPTIFIVETYLHCTAKPNKYKQLE